MIDNRTKIDGSAQPEEKTPLTPRQEADKLVDDTISKAYQKQGEQDKRFADAQVRSNANDGAFPEEEEGNISAVVDPVQPSVDLITPEKPTLTKEERQKTANEKAINRDLSGNTYKESLSEVMKTDEAKRYENSFNRRYSRQSWKRGCQKDSAETAQGQIC